MTKTLETLSDRLLALVVPKITAKADPCGEYYEFCYCSGNNAYTRFCCRKGGCNPCRRTGPCPV